MKKSVLYLTIYALIITIVFGSIFILTEGTVKHRIFTAEELEKTECDGVCLIDMGCSEIYNNRLYEPADFGKGSPDGLSENADYDNYLTYRFFINTVPGVTYGFYSKKSDYAMRVFADGREIASAGKVAANDGDFIPSTESPSGFFIASGKKTEIIIQQANFNHIRHYDLSVLTGPSADIVRYSTLFYIGRTIMFISLITAGLMNLGMYFFFDRKRRYLYFACLCLVGAVNYATPFLIAVIFKNISWYLSHRIEYCSKILIAFFAVAYTNTVFEGCLNKNLKRVFMAYSFAGIALTVFLPSITYTRISNPGAYILAALLSLMLLNIVYSLNKNRFEIEVYKKLIIFGVAVVFVFALVELFGFSSKTYNAISTETGIVVFTFINTVALALDFKDTSRMLDEAKMREKELLQANEAVVKLGNMRDTFLADLSHELKTPLTVISNISALTAYQLKNGLADEKTAEGLSTIENEAVRLGKMVDNLKQKSVTGFENSGEKVSNLSSTLISASAFCEPLCKRNNNRITVKCKDGIGADISEDLVFHCLYNLISNATRHCRNNVIELAGFSENDKTVITVTDHGDGMTDEEKSKAFDRGYSGDKGTGIGLALCREITENNGGAVVLSDTPGGGLTVTVTFDGC